MRKAIEPEDASSASTKDGSAVDKSGKPVVKPGEPPVPGAPAPGTGDAAKSGVFDKDGKPIAFDKIPRFQELSGQVKALEPDANQWRAVTRYMDETGLSTEDVADALQLHALMKADPVKGREALATILAAMDKNLGNVLADDLKAKVDTGELTEDAALELSRARSAAARAEGRATAVTTRATKQDQDNAHRQMVNDIRSGIGTWEAEAMKTDPDFEKKRGSIGIMVRNILHARGQPYQSAQDALDVVKQAYALANDFIKQLTPGPSPRAGSLDSGGSRRVANTAPPKTLFEALNRAL